MNYILPGSQKLSFIEEAAQVGVVIACWMAGFFLMYLFLDACIKAF